VYLSCVEQVAMAVVVVAMVAVVATAVVAMAVSVCPDPHHPAAGHVGVGTLLLSSSGILG